MTETSRTLWPFCDERMIIRGMDGDLDFCKDEDKIVVYTDGWREGPAAAVLRGGTNAGAVLEVLASSGMKEVIIYHIEERIAQHEEIFLSTVINEANRLFENVKIIWRHDPNLCELIRNIGHLYNMLLIGAPLAKSELPELYKKVKDAYHGSLSIIRGTLSEETYSEGDDLLKWIRERTFDAQDYALPSVLRNYKNRYKMKIDVLLPALNEEKTIGKVIETAMEVKEAGLIDHIFVIDSDSTDHTVEIAQGYGVPVYKHSSIRPDLKTSMGKGEAMFKSALISQADVMAWIDTDIENIAPTFFYGLLGPMLAHPEIQFVKGYFERPVRIETTGIELGGGRVTEILVRPWINAFMPSLSGYIQPLAGTVAIRSDLFRRMRIPTNYGVEIAMLAQAVEMSGLWSTCQVNLGEVIHKSKDVVGLSEMSFQILQVLKSMQNRFAPQGSTLRHIYSSEGHFEIGIKRFDVIWRDFTNLDQPMAKPIFQTEEFQEIG
ncbi:MAG TPA: glucosyl-3-phosphoglycerate synthase [Bacillota bacterium]|nr:glucosyl-3-phosphoglycerate synthase [Bacillota bacterium]